MKELLVRVISKKRDGHEAAVIASGLKLVRCPRSLAVTRHGFTFYVADPSAPFSSPLIYFRLATSRTPNRKLQAARDF
jgi:hypothetical protein